MQIGFITTTKLWHLICFIGSLPALAGCMVGPDYQRPTIAMPEYVVPGRSAKDVADENWWRSLGNKELTSLIIKAVENNNVITAAAERSNAVLSGVLVVQSRLYPDVNYALGAYRVRGAGDRKEISTYTGTAPIAAKWTVDLWGRIRRQVESAEALSLASEEAWRGVILTVTSQVALSYIRYRLAEEQLRITQPSHDTLKVYVDRLVASGRANEATLSQWRYTLQLFIADLPLFEAAQQDALLNLRQLTNDLNLTLPKSQGMSLRLDMPQKIRSDALLRRPDVAQAEQELRAANASIGEAEAAALPEFSISATGGIGYNQLKPGPLLNAWSPLWALAAQSTGPIFNAGATQARIDIANARTREALAKYNEAILDAFTDAQYALVAYQAAKRRVVELRQAVKDLNQSASLIISTDQVNAQSQAGDVASLLIIVNRLYTAQLALALAKSREMDAVVGVYQAIGGGWVDYLSDKSKKAYEAQGKGRSWPQR